MPNYPFSFVLSRPEHSRLIYAYTVPKVYIKMESDKVCQPVLYFYWDYSNLLAEGKGPADSEL